MCKFKTCSITSLYMLLHDKLHPAVIYYMIHYILLNFITCITWSWTHYILPELITCITWSRIHYILPYFITSITWFLNRLHAQCSCSGRCSERSVAPPARSARAWQAVMFLLDLFFQTIFQRTVIDPAASSVLWSSTSSAWNVQDVTAKYSSNPAKIKDWIS